MIDFRDEIEGALFDAAGRHSTKDPLMCRNPSECRYDWETGVIGRK